MYNQKILDIFKNPYNAGGLHGANGIGKVTQESTGDVVKIYIKVNENGVIEESRFKTMGCVPSIVASSILTELAVDKSLEVAGEITYEDILEVMGDLEEEKYIFVKLAIDALKVAIQDYYKKKEKEEKSKKM